MVSALDSRSCGSGSQWVPALAVALRCVLRQDTNLTVPLSAHVDNKMGTEKKKFPIKYLTFYSCIFHFVYIRNFNLF